MNFLRKFFSAFLLLLLMLLLLMVMLLLLVPFEIVVCNKFGNCSAWNFAVCTSPPPATTIQPALVTSLNCAVLLLAAATRNFVE